MLAEARVHLDGSSIFVEVADPMAPELEDLDLGDTYDGRMMATLFASQTFAVHRDPPTLYRFSLADGTTVAYAVIEDTEMPYPHFSSADFLNCVHLHLLGVREPFQRRQDPVSGATYAMEVMRAIEEVIAPNATSPVGIALAVRVDNKSARNLYERMGYVADVGSFPDVTLGKLDWWMAMRKPLA